MMDGIYDDIMKQTIFTFYKDKSHSVEFRWSNKHYEFCMDNHIFLSHRRRKMYKAKNPFLLRKGDKVKIDKSVIVEEYSTMPVKSFCSVGAFSYPTCHFPGNVKIGRYCSIASGVKIMGGQHPINRFTTHMLTYNGAFDVFAKDEFNADWKLNPFNTELDGPVIGHDVWIADDVVLKGGITIGHGAIIAANSVVTKDVPPYAIVGGVPASIIRYRFEQDIIDMLLKTQWWNYRYTDLPDNTRSDDIVFFAETLHKAIEKGEIAEVSYKQFHLAQVLGSL